LGAGLRQVTAAIRERKEKLTNPLAEARDTAFYIETLEEIGHFMDHFALGASFSESVDDSYQLRCRMIDEVADALVGSVGSTLHHLDSDSCFFSYSMAPPLTVLHQRLRALNFLDVARNMLPKLGAMLLNQLLWHAPFDDRQDMDAFIDNCAHDLRSILIAVLDVSELVELSPLWDGCKLLKMPDSEAKATLERLRMVEFCPTSYALNYTGSLDDLKKSENRDDATGKELQKRRAEVFAAAGIKNLSASDAIAVFKKRQELQEGTKGLEELSFEFNPLAQLGAQLNVSSVGDAKQLAAGAAKEVTDLARTISATGAAQKGQKLLQNLGQVAQTLRPLSKTSSV